MMLVNSIFYTARMDGIDVATEEFRRMAHSWFDYIYGNMDSSAKQSIKYMIELHGRNNDNGLRNPQATMNDPLYRNWSLNWTYLFNGRYMSEENREYHAYYTMF